MASYPCYKMMSLRLSPLCMYVLIHLQHYCFLNKVTCSDELLKNSVKNSKQTLLRIGIAEYTLLAVEMFWSSEVQMVDLLELDALHGVFP